ncbi:hypothetical protein EA462_09535 [Natrarchaeobius halalkaliphilus]|uniref:Uncharacterized protein n=1 Tax=Natrarchaeobius halalkaliphilus TaxID=1679091 RepID=A0A3N6LPU6_9EURY|nr:hypothetical protein [Natrarchaeobius halalkaliphilus]RQG90217.1 hypothetical protein EA462_09535 [Natrarchaeobius halalkaliphilus]
MDENRTVVDILERVRESRRHRRCPDCEEVCVIRGFRGEYRWECSNCESLGIGYATRAAALDGIRNRRG